MIAVQRQRNGTLHTIGVYRYRPGRTRGESLGSLPQISAAPCARHDSRALAAEPTELFYYTTQQNNAFYQVYLPLFYPLYVYFASRPAAWHAASRGAGSVGQVRPSALHASRHWRQASNWVRAF